MKQTMRSLLKVFCLLLILISCTNSGEEPENTPYKPINLDLKTASVIESSNKFGLKLYKQLLQEVESGKNVLISPLSVSQALCMTRNGAKGQTKNEITQVLTFDETLEDDINISQEKLVKALKGSDNQVTMNIANSIWYRNDFSIIPDFIQTNATHYDAEVSALDFSLSEETKRIINNWVNNKTEGKIEEVVDEVSADHVMFLINAIYFYGEWMNSFEKANTQEALFYKENGASVTCEMMHQSNNFAYAQNEIFKMIELPYGNGHFNMVILLPQQEKTVDDIINELSDVLWSQWNNQLVKEEVVLSLPKFKFGCEYELKKPLVDMGMSTAFSGAADFSGITENAPIAISKVKHKTFIEVDEEGTEAAAVTSVEMELTSMPQEFVFNANKPFVLAITEKDTEAILFIGKLMEP